MPIGDPGKEQFRNAIMQMRNLHIAAGLAPLILFREEVVTNDNLNDRGGLDNNARDQFMGLLANADKWRRRVTHNPDNKPLGDKIAKAINADESIEDADNPFGGDDIQMGSGNLFNVPWALDGSDVDIPLNSTMRRTTPNGIVLLAAIDESITAWTRLNSRDRTWFITQTDSMRIYGHYQQIYGFLTTFAGDKNRTDVAQVPPSREPLGADNSPNRKTESVGDSQKGG